MCCGVCSEFLVNTGVARIFVGGGPGLRHPSLHQSGTRLKLLLAAGDLPALQQSADSWVELQSEIKIWEMTFGGGFFVNVVSLKYIGMI